MLTASGVWIAYCWSQSQPAQHRRQISSGESNVDACSMHAWVHVCVCWQLQTMAAKSSCFWFIRWFFVMITNNFSGSGWALSRSDVFVCVSRQKLLYEMIFNLDSWHTGLPWCWFDKFETWKSRLQVMVIGWKLFFSIDGSKANLNFKL